MPVKTTIPYTEGISSSQQRLPIVAVEDQYKVDGDVAYYGEEE
jgi:hypothetical protein